MRKGAKRQAGMTLVEVLVAISIIAVLGTAVAGAARHGIARADQSKCMNNLRQIGLGLQFFADDHHGIYPETSHTAAQGKSWVYALEAYLGEFDEVRICPADPLGKDRLKYQGTSYLLNSLVFVPETDAFGESTGIADNRPASLPDPARTLLVFCCSDHVGVRPGDDHTHSDRWSTWSAVRRDIAPDRHFRKGDDGTQGAANYLFADGHVESWTALHVKQHIERGDNIARIPGKNAY